MATQQEKLQKQKEEVEIKRPKGTVYRVNEAGEIEELAPPLNAQDMIRQGYGGKATREAFYFGGMGKGSKEYKDLVDKFNKDKKDYPYKTLREAANEASKITKKSVADIEKKYQDSLSLNNSYNAIADQIRGLTGRGGRAGGGTMYAGGSPNFDESTGTYRDAPYQLSAERNFGSSDLANKLNFQVSDQQIIDDFNQAKLGRLNRIVTDGGAQITGIGERISTANRLLASLPANDPRRVSSEAYIKELQADLKSVQDAVANAQGQITNFTPVTANSDEGLRQITSFREFVKLPEERAGDQLRQIDPEAYKTAVGLGQKYRKMATEDLPDTTDPRTEQLRGTLEDEAVNQLRLGSTLDQEVRRNVEQGVRAAQTARGNIYGLGPAVEEAMQTGLAGEQRKLARYGAASQFLNSGQTRSDALRENLAFRDTLLQNRLGRAADFIAAGPSLGNLAQARVNQQQNMFANYINANQANPGQFNPQANQVPFYQTANPNAGFMGAQTAANIYNTLADYQASTYGNQVSAIASSYRSPAQSFASIAGGFGSIFGSLFPKGF